MNPMHGRFARLYLGTRAEAALEPAVAALGVPYRTQFPCHLYAGGLRYFLDFFLPTLRVVIEVDDDSHKEKAAEDAARTADIERTFGVRVFRCTNEEALSRPAETVNRLMAQAGLPNRIPVGPLPSLSLPPPAPSRQQRRRQSARRANGRRRATR